MTQAGDGGVPLPDAGWRTLGVRLDEQARRRLDRLVPRIAWAGLVAPVLARAEAQRGGQDRFARVDGVVAAQRLAARRHALTEPAMAGTRRTPPAAAPQAPAAEEAAARATVRPQPAQPLTPIVRGRLREELGPVADVVRIRTDDHADAVARALRADAVTLGTEVHFRRGRYLPHEDRGFALLSHEARHVMALLRPSEVAGRGDPAGIGREERAASGVETRALTRRRRGGPPRPPDGAAGVAHSGERDTGPALHGSRHQTAARAMTAPADRAIGETAEPPRPPVDVAQLKRELMADLMHRLRSEFERGG